MARPGSDAVVARRALSPCRDLARIDGRARSSGTIGRRAFEMTIEFRRMIRRGALAGLAPLLLLAVAQHARAADVAPLRGKRIVFVEPDRPGSVTDLPLALMRDEIARKAGAAVDIVAIGAPGGGPALDSFSHAAAAL